MIRWTGLAPWEFEQPVVEHQGGPHGGRQAVEVLTVCAPSTESDATHPVFNTVQLRPSFFSSLLLASLELSDTQVYEP